MHPAEYLLEGFMKHVEPWERCVETVVTFSLDGETGYTALRYQSSEGVCKMKRQEKIPAYGINEKNEPRE